ncbi:von Willebrand factor D and EGF domain-containing protein [Liparis tanakae]|uniref:von Willebrand factor D and EGF domain-containing protein n=1 Tax=Liparis tanakae TaxID=230148 RepID=A0A4Z2FYT1_9TELE|nr:von Willebrand factor D and EGF domain-containing protein [Liparis tanakae]
MFSLRADPRVSDHGVPCCLSGLAALPPECVPGGHSVLREPHRSTAFSSAFSTDPLQQSGLQDLVCDHALAAGWYRFQIFDKPASMPTQCVEVNHCGTQAPVWLSLGEGESLPGPLEVRPLTACAAWRLLPGTGTDCCMFRLPVTVRSCGDFYVYLLQPTQGCMGYCAQGSVSVPCNNVYSVNEWRFIIIPSVFTEMPDAPPTAPPSCGPDAPTAGGTCATPQPPAPSAPVIVPEVAGRSVSLRCSFGSVSNSSVGHVVAWSRLSPEGRKEELKRETTVETSARIELDGFNLRLGDKIYCSSSSFLLDSPNVLGAPVQSAEFFAGITLRAERRGVPEDGRPYELLVESSVPVPCAGAAPCALTLQLSTSSADEDELGSDLSLSSCVAVLTRRPCRGGVCGRARVTFSAVTDLVNDGDRTTRIAVTPIVTQNSLWSGYSPEPVEEKSCSIAGRCYGEGEAHPSSPCLACRPDSSKHAWAVAEKNEPPELQSLPLGLRFFRGETLVYQLQARDPEGSAPLFALVSGPRGASLSPAGLLTWRASAETTDTPTFTFTVTDECHQETEASIQVSVLSCECLNGASCVTNAGLPAGSGEYLCVCPDGFKGERCQVDVDDCKPNPCRLGRCIDGPASFSCVCPPGMTGRTCREDIDECVSRPCPPGLGCNNTPGSFVCGLCLPGFRADGTVCSLETDGRAPRQVRGRRSKNGGGAKRSIQT